MPIIIKEIHVRTVVERHIVSETEISDKVIQKIESRVVDRLSALTGGQPVERRQARRYKER